MRMFSFFSVSVPNGEGGGLGLGLADVAKDSGQPGAWQDLRRGCSCRLRAFFPCGSRLL